MRPGSVSSRAQRRGAQGYNEDEIADLVRWSHGRAFDLTLIETVPMGEIDADRTDQYLPRARKARVSAPRSTISLHVGGAGALCARRRDGWQTRLHHAVHSYFCEVTTGFGSLAPAHSICVSGGRSVRGDRSPMVFRGLAKRSMRAISIPAQRTSDKRSRLSGSRSEADRWLELVSQ